MKKDEDNFDNFYKKLESTSASKKTWLYFKEVAKSDSFQGSVKRIRGKYKIPDYGFNDSRLTIPPKEWFSKKERYDKLRELTYKIEKICFRYGLHFNGWEDTILTYIFYNRLIRYYDDMSFSSLCMFSDLREEHLDPFSDKTIKADNKYFPVAVRISPYASQRDILDYVKKIYTHLIKPCQEKYKEKNLKINKIRKKNKEARNAFIYTKRDLPIKEIRQKVVKRFKEYLDDGNIGKIISLEKKRRKEM